MEMATAKEQQSSRVRWTAEMEDILVDLWQDHECLYNVSSKNDHNRYDKDKSWGEIAAVLSIPGPQPSTQQEDGPSPPTSRLGSSRHRGEETVEHQKLKLLQQMSASIVSKPAPDAYTSFGNHVADELRLLKNVAIQTNVKRKIMNALFEFQEADQCSQQPSTLLPPAPYPTFSPAQTPAHLTHTNTVTNPSPCRPYYSGTTYTNL